MRSRLLTWVLLLALLCMVSSCHANAMDAENTDVMEDDDDIAMDGIDDLMAGTASHVPLVVCGAIFPNSTSPLFPTISAGSKANAVVSFQNNHDASTHTIVLASGYLQPPRGYNVIIQNFSVVRHGRIVPSGESITFQYSFTPNAHLEPGEYNLVIGLYTHDSITNNTFFVPAFNATVMIEESLDTDPRTILTYITLFVIFLCIAYIPAEKFGLVKAIRSMVKGKKANPQGRPQLVELGTRGEGYDPDYVSKEHLRVREEVMRKTSASPKQRNASPKKMN